MDIMEFVDRLYCAAEKSNIEEFQIKFLSQKDSGLTMFEQKIETSDNSEAQRIRFSIRDKGKIGSFVYEGAWDENVIPMMIKEARENVLLISDEDDSFFYDGKGEYNNDIQPYTPIWKELKYLDKIEFLKNVEKSAYNKSPLVNKVIKVGYFEFKSKLVIRNSLGLNVCKDIVSVGAHLKLSVKQNDEVKDAYESVDFSLAEHFNPQYLADKTVNTAIEKLNGESFKTGEYKVVLKNEAMRRLLAIIADLFFAQSVIDKVTKFGDKVGQKIAFEGVTIVENPFMKGGHSTASFDGEGYPTSYKEIVKNGILQSLLYDLKTANKFNTSSTGNGGYLGNLYIQNGVTCFDDLLACVGNGILIEQVSGLNVGIDKVSGDFSVVGSGKKIENGKIVCPLTPFTVSGNLYQLLQNITEVGNDLDFCYSSIGTPSVVVETGIMLANK